MYSPTSSRWFKYETVTRQSYSDFGEVVQINNDNTVNVHILGYNSVGDPILLEKVQVEGNYTPKVGDWVSIEWKNGNPVVTSGLISSTINLNDYSATITSSTQITSGVIIGDHISSRTISAEKIQTGTITANEIQTGTITADSGIIADAAITTAKIADLAVSEAKIADLAVTEAKIADLAVTTAKINDLAVTEAKIADLAVTNAKINDLDASKITAGDIAGERLKANVISAINAHVQGLDVSQVDADNIHADAIEVNVIDAINANVGFAEIDGAIIQDATITTAKIADLSVTNAKISDLNASKITAGDIAADRMKANVVDAINLYTGTARIDQAKIEDLDASKIVSGTIDTTKVTISTNASGTGARLDFLYDGMYIFDDADNVMARLTNEGFVVHVPGGIKIDSGGTIRVGPTEDIVISGEGIKSKAGGDNYTAFFTGDGLRFEDPNNPQKQLIMSAGEIKLTTDGGQTVSTALTPDGFYGNLLVDYSLPPEKFDTTPPAIPTWREEGLTSVVEQTSGGEIVCIIVKWNEVSDDDLEGYKIYLQEEGSTVFYPIAVVGKTNEYKIRGVKSNTTYKVKVSSFDRQGNECNTSTPLDNNLTTYEKTIVTVKDTVAPAQPVSSPIIVNGLKEFGIKWNEVTTNEDGSECLDLAYYELQRYSSKDEKWTTIAKIKGISFVDDDVEYSVEYKYRYRAVDTSGNVSDWSPETFAGEPTKVGSNDIVANSITTSHISTTGLDASVITSGKIHGSMIEADTITADKFESRLHGDIVQALRYVQSKLSELLYTWQSSQENYDSGTYNGTCSYNGILMLETVHKWDEDGLEWDDPDLYWDKPVVTQGTWESPVLDIGENTTVLNICRMSYSVPSGASLTVYTRYSEDGVNWTEYEEFKGVVTTCRYAQFKIELQVQNTDENIYLDNFEFEFYINDDSTFVDNILTLNAGYKGDSPTEEYGLEIERGSLRNASLIWDGSNDVWKAGLKGYEEEIILANNPANIPGVSPQLFQIGGGAQLKNNSGVLEIRNSVDSDYADLVVKDLTVKGTTITIESQVVNIGDSIITLNEDGNSICYNNGNVGIGTTNFTHDEHTDPIKFNTEGTFHRFARENSDPHLELFFNGIPSVNATVGRLKFMGKNSIGTCVGFAQIVGGVTDSTNGAEKGYLTFNINSGGNTPSWGLREVMRITSDENVGIGTTSPDEKLEVVGKTKSSEGFETGNFEIVYNSSTKSLDFNVVA